MRKWAKLVGAFLSCGLIAFWGYRAFQPETPAKTQRERMGKTVGLMKEAPPSEVQPVEGQSYLALEKNEVGTRGATGPISTQSINERRSSAQRMMKEGRPERALAELLSCLNDSFAKGVNKGIRHVILMNLVELGKSYEPAKTAVTDYRDAARELMVAEPTNSDYAVTLGTINKLIGEETSTVAVLDSLPAADPRRKVLGIYAFDALVDKRRYADAADAKGLALMLQSFEGAASYAASKTTETYRSNIVADAAKDIEALAGSNKLDEAQVLINRVLSYDGSVQVKRIIKERLVKSGAPLDLFTGL